MRRTIKIILGLALLLGLIVGGFALGIYLRILDTHAINEEYGLGLHELPVVGEFFMPPLEDEVAEDVATNTATTTTTTTAIPAGGDVNEPNKAARQQLEQPSIRITPEEIAKQAAEREAEEKKRITKLARLYDGMKAKDAAEAMELLNIDLCISILQRMDEGNASKVLAAFEAGKAAQITQIMYSGQQERANNNLVQ